MAAQWILLMRGMGIAQGIDVIDCSMIEKITTCITFRKGKAWPFDDPDRDGQRFKHWGNLKQGEVMRLLVLINNYMGGNTSNSKAAVGKVVETFHNYTQLDVDVVLFSTAAWDDPQAVNLVYPESLNYDFAYVHRQWLAENFCCLSHDYFMYTENDLIIPESAVLNCIAINDYLGRFSDRLISGFIRFERKPEKKYIDMLPCARPTVEKLVQSNDGKKFWIPGNLHSGNCLLSRGQLGYLIDHHLLQLHFGQYGKQFGGILESAASDVYLDFIKVLPEDFTTVEIEHLSGKYEGLTHHQLAQEVAMPSGRIGS